MAGTKQSRGQCAYCKQEFTKSSITKHLNTCAARQNEISEAEKKKIPSGKLYHLRIQANDLKQFWLDLEMRGDTTLKDLDYYLREIWLECCGHLSRFSPGKQMRGELPMNSKANNIFSRETELFHVYDFGSSTETLIKVVAVREGKPTSSHPIALMARNIMPESPCIECGEPAAYLCLECMQEEMLWATVCKKHFKKHSHDEFGDPIGLVNSPRLGTCGYDGPAEPPY